MLIFNIVFAPSKGRDKWTNGRVKLFSTTKNSENILKRWGYVNSFERIAQLWLLPELERNTSYVHCTVLDWQNQVFCVEMSACRDLVALLNVKTRYVWIWFRFLKYLGIFVPFVAFCGKWSLMINFLCWIYVNHWMWINFNCFRSFFLKFSNDAAITSVVNLLIALHGPTGRKSENPILKILSPKLHAKEWRW